MPAYSLGAHAYFFTQYGFKQSTQHDEIFKIVAAAGYPAIEVHSESVEAPDSGDRIRKALDCTGLRFIGVSFGAPFWDIGDYDNVIRSAETLCAKLTELNLGPLKSGCSVTGKRFAERTDAENEQCVKVMKEVAQLFRSRGHQFLYHNHGEPIDDVQLVLDHIPADVMRLCPDLDWLRVGGIDQEPFLRENRDRIAMIHVRDYFNGGTRAEALGEGDADFGALAKLLDEIGFTGELIVELALPSSKQRSRTPQELLEISRRHVRRTMGL